MPPYLTNQAPWFTFLVHPRATEDLDYFDAASFLRRYSDSDEEFIEKSYSMEPLVAARLQIGTSPAWGELIAVMKPPEVIMTPAGRQEVHAAVDVAVSRRTRVIGLGALTSPATGAGLTLVPRLPKGVTVTTGNALTAVVARDNVVEASSFLELGNRARVAVLGCTGSVGKAASNLLAEMGYPLLLIGRSRKRALHLLPELQGRADFTGDRTTVADAQIVLVLTSDPSAELTPGMLQPGTVVVDCAQPANIPDPAAFERRGVLVREGGIVRIPGFRCGYDFRFRRPDETFACLAETYLFSREGITAHSAGRASVELARELEILARKRGIEPRSLQLEHNAWSREREGAEADLPHSDLDRVAG